MEQLNRYYRCSKISGRKFLRVLRHFALDLTASRTAQLTGLTRKSVNVIFLKIRERIAEECERASPFSSCEVEVDGSSSALEEYAASAVAGRLVKPLSSASSTNGCVYTEIVPDCKKATLQAIIRGRVAAEAVIHSDGCRGYDGLVDVGYSKHFRVNHGSNEFVRGTAHVNGIEGFWSFAKRRLQKFNGVSSETFNLHLKECEYRFNNRNKNLYRELLKLLRKNPL